MHIFGLEMNVHRRRLSGYLGLSCSALIFLSSLTRFSVFVLLHLTLLRNLRAFELPNTFIPGLSLGRLNFSVECFHTVSLRVYHLRYCSSLTQRHSDAHIQNVKLHFTHKTKR